MTTAVSIDAWRPALVSLSILIPRKGRQDVSGYVADAVPGLAITPVWSVRGVEDRTRWQITHEETGCRVVAAAFRSTAEAQRAAVRFAPLTDWRAFVASDELRERCLEIAREEGAIDA